MSKRKDIQKAEKFLANGKLHKALDLYLKVVKESPDDPNLLNSVGDIFVRIGEPKQAVPHFQRAAESYEKTGFRVKAIAILRKAYRQAPFNTELVSTLVGYLRKEGLIADARQLLIEQARRRDEAGQKSEAKKYYETILELDANHIPSLLALNKIAQEEGDKEAAANIISTLSEKLLLAGKLDEAIEIISTAYKSTPEDPSIMRIYADLLKLTGDQETSSQLYYKLLELNPNDAGVLVSLAELAIELNNMTKARAYFIKAQQFDPDSKRITMLGAGLAMMDEDFDAAYTNLSNQFGDVTDAKGSNPAIAGFEEIIRRKPTHLPTLKKLKDIYTYLEDRSNIIRVLDLTIDSYEKAGDYRLAIAAAEELKGIDSERISNQMRIEKLYEKAGGAGIFEHATTVNNGSSEVPESLDYNTTTGRFKVEIEPAKDDGFSLQEPEELEPELDDPAKRILLEVDVFIRYGLTYKAKDKINEALELYPNNASLTEKLAEVYLEEEDLETAHEVLVRARDQWKSLGNNDKVKEINELLADIDSGTATTSAELVISDDDEFDEDFVAEYAGAGETHTDAGSEHSTWVPSTDPLQGKIMEAEYYLEQKFISAAHHLISDLKEKHASHPKITQLSEQLEKLMSKEMDVAEVEKDLDEFFSPLEDFSEVGGDGDNDDSFESMSSLLDDDSPLSEIASLLEEDLSAIHIAAEKRRENFEQAGENLQAEDIQISNDQVYNNMVKNEASAKHYEMGLAYLETGLYEDAIKGFTIAAEDPIFFQKTCLQMGICYINMGDDQNAVSWLQKGISGGGDIAVMVDSLHQLAIIYQITGEIDSFKHALAQLESLDPQHPGLATLKALE